MKQYHDICKHILEHGEERTDRTGVGTLSTFGYQTRYNLEDGFPLVTTKRVYWKGIVHELLWFLKGDTNIKYLVDNNVHIWDEWADKDGNLGPVYGKQWRSWTTIDGDPYRVDSHMNVFHIDQIEQVINQIKTNPQSRRLIVSAWNVGDLPDMALPPCHLLFQFYVSNDKKLSCQLYQRSCDAFLGLPFNIGSYALLTFLLAQVCGLRPGSFIHSIGDLHIYKNHIDQVNLQLTRDPRPLPKLILNPDIKDIDKFNICDIHLEGYDPHPAIKGEVAV